MEKILAIDDKMDNLVALSALLKNLMPDCAMITAQSGMEGIEKARAELPDAILLDVKMPDMDGFETCRRLKTDESTNHIPVIMMTAMKTDSQSRVKGLEIGADAFLSKPIDEAELVSQVKVALRIKKAEDTLRQERDSLERTVQERTAALHQSEEIFSQFMEHSPIYVFFKDDQMRSLRLSTNYEKMLGKPLKELLGKTMDDLFPSDLAKRMIADDLRVLREGKEIVVEEELNGRHYSTMKFPIHVDGKPRYLAGYTIDITERKKAEQALRDSQGTVRSLLNATTDLMFLIDTAGTFVALNETTAKRFGKNIIELLGACIYDFFPPSIAKARQACFDEAVLSSRPIHFEDQREGAWFYTSVYPVLDGQGKVTKLAIYARDITERKRAEEELRTSQEEAMRMAQENAAMAKIGRIIGSTLNIEDVYEQFAEEVRKLIPFDGITVHMIDREKDIMTFPYLSGITVGRRHRGDTIPFTGSVAEEVTRTRSGAIIEIDDSTPLKGRYPYLATAYESGIRSLMVVPLISKDQVIGTIHFRSVQSETYSDRDLKIAENIASQIAGAVANAQLFAQRERAEEALRESEEEARRLAGESATMAEIGRIISSTLNIEEVYERFAEKVDKLIPFDEVSINLIEYEKGIVTFHYVAGIAVVGRQKGETIPLTGSVTEEVAQTRCGVIIEMDDSSKLKRRYPVLSKAYQAGLRSLMMVPLISKDQVIGTIHFRSVQSKAYSERDLRVAEGIASQIAGAIANARLYAERIEAEGALQKSEERFRELYDDAPVGYLECDGEGRITSINRAVLEMLGYSSDEMIGQPLWKLSVEEEPSRERILAKLAGMLPPGRNLERTYRRKDGAVIPVLIGDRFILDEKREIKGILCAIQDITERKQVEEERAVLTKQLQQSQKMEAIGTLAGGIAHDFNNILAAILGYAELANLDLEEDSKVKYNLEQSIKATHRAKDLVQQILAFSRQGKQERKLLNIEPIIKEGLKFLRASLPTTLEIRQNVEKHLGTIKADPTQVHQILMNLCTNAAHAMEEKGGVLEVSLGNLDIDKTSAASVGIKPGSYLRLRVSDTGQGMPVEVLRRIFDPYFTTKEIGKGTGLGLAVVHGIVESYGGGITVSSEEGKGSTFDVYFPRIESVNVPLESDQDEAFPFGRHERVLFVDDEEAIAEIGREILQRLGYEVVARTSSVEALALFRVKPDQFDLVITDMTMPNMTGDKLAQELLRIRPGIPIILCTGFSEHITEQKAKEMGIRGFAMKPLVIRDLARTIRGVLEHEKK